MADGQQPLRLLCRIRAHLPTVPSWHPERRPHLPYESRSHHLRPRTRGAPRTRPSAANPSTPSHHFRSGFKLEQPVSPPGPAPVSWEVCSLPVFSISGVSINNVDVEKELDGNHLVISSTLTHNHQVIHTDAFVDTEDSGFAFIDENFPCQHNLPLTPLKTSRALEVIDG